MIQRIQTIYLLIVAVLISLTTFVPTLTCLDANGAEYTLSFSGFRPTEAEEMAWTSLTCWMPLLTLTITAISLFSIFLFRHRTAQIRLNVFNTCLMVGYYALFFLVRFTLESQLEGNYLIRWPVVMPFIAAIVNVMAIRAIAADEALVRSVERFR